MSFHRVSVDVSPANYKAVNWAMDTSRGLPATVNFYVDKARSGGEWQQIAGPLADQCQYIDRVIWNWAQDKDTFYRIRYHDGSAWIYSTPASATGVLSSRDYTIAREICRKEYLTMRMCGLSGSLLRRKEWGTPCPNCRDYDTKEIVDVNCKECLGVGILEGYYAPIPMPLSIMQPASGTRTRSESGSVQPLQRTVRAVGYPLINSFDVWVSGHTGARWMVRNVQTAVELRETALVLVLELRQIPRSDVLYKHEAIIKATETPAVQPTGNEHGWVPDSANCLDM